MDPILATVIYFAGNFAPQGWLFCDGSELHIEQNEALFSLLGTKFGGDGIEKFNLPKIPDLEGLKAIICAVGVYPPRP